MDDRPECPEVRGIRTLRQLRRSRAVSESGWSRAVSGDHARVARTDAGAHQGIEWRDAHDRTQLVPLFLKPLGDAESTQFFPQGLYSLAEDHLVGAAEVVQIFEL